MRQTDQQTNEVEILDNFHIIKELGRGASGIVKLGLSLDQGRLFALKLLKVPSLLEKFKREYEILSKIDHENVIKVFGFKNEGTYTKKSGETLKVTYFVMTYVPHGEIFNIIYQKKAFSENLARFYFSQLLNAIQFLHDQKIYHRDLKPENLLLDENYRLILSDFGYSKELGEASIAKTRLGTPGYVAPEILAGQFYDPVKADIFSAGVTLFVIYSRNIPFKEASLNDKAYKMLFENPSFMFGYYQQHCQKNYSDALRSLFLGVLCLNPEKRLSVAEIRKSDWLAAEVDRSAAELEIQEILGLNIAAYEFRSITMNVALKEEKLFRTSSKENFLMLENLPKILENAEIGKIAQANNECKFDWVLKCSSSSEFLRLLNQTVKNMGGSLFEGNEGEILAKLISKADFEILNVELKLYRTESGLFCCDLIRVQGSYFGYLNVKEDFKKQLEAVIKENS